MQLGCQSRRQALAKSQRTDCDNLEAIILRTSVNLSHLYEQILREARPRH